MGTWCRRIAQSDGFEDFILCLIVINAALLGLETSKTLELRYGEIFYYAFLFSQLIFVAEIVIRLLAYAPRFPDFFRNAWNVFDFVVVAASLIPAVGGFALIARIARLFRVVRILSVSDEMRSFIEGMSRTFGLLAKTTVLLGVLGYMFAISGYYLFSEGAPQSWGTLGDSFRSVFFLALLQRVPEFVAEVPTGDLLGKLFFPIFYLVYGAIGLNLIGAVAARYQTRGDFER